MYSAEGARCTASAKLSHSMRAYKYAAGGGAKGEVAK